MSKLQGTFRSVVLPAMLAVVLLAAGPLSADPPDRAKLNGAYNMKLVGDYTGSGKVIVTPKQIHLNLDMKPAEGGSFKLSLNSMPLVEGGFQGQQIINNVVFTVLGRIEAADGTVVLTPRVSCIITASDETVARAIGHRTSD